VIIRGRALIELQRDPLALGLGSDDGATGEDPHSTKTRPQPPRRAGAQAPQIETVRNEPGSKCTTPGASTSQASGKGPTAKERQPSPPDGALSRAEGCRHSCRHRANAPGRGRRVRPPRPLRQEAPPSHRRSGHARRRRHACRRTSPWRRNRCYGSRVPAVRDRTRRDGNC